MNAEDLYDRLTQFDPRTSDKEQTDPQNLIRLKHWGFRYLDHLNYLAHLATENHMENTKYLQAYTFLYNHLKDRYLKVMVINPLFLLNRYPGDPDMNATVMEYIPIFFKDYIKVTNLTMLFILHTYLKPSLKYDDQKTLDHTILTRIQKGEKIQYRKLTQHNFYQDQFYRSAIFTLDLYRTEFLTNFQVSRFYFQILNWVGRHDNRVAFINYFKHIIKNINHEKLLYNKKYLCRTLNIYLSDRIFYRWLIVDSKQDEALAEMYNEINYFYEEVMIGRTKLTPEDLIWFVKEFMDLPEAIFLSPIAFSLSGLFFEGDAFYNWQLFLRTRKIDLQSLEPIIARHHKTYQKFKRVMLSQIDIIQRDPKFPAYLSRGRVSLDKDLNIEL